MDLFLLTLLSAKLSNNCHIAGHLNGEGLVFIVTMILILESVLLGSLFLSIIFCKD